MRNLVKILVLSLILLIMFFTLHTFAYSLMIFYSDITFQGITKDDQIYLLLDESSIFNIDSYLSSAAEYKRNFNAFANKMGDNIINVENLLLDNYKNMDKKYKTTKVSGKTYYKLPVNPSIVDNTTSIAWIGNITQVIIERKNGKEDVIDLENIKPFSYTDDSVKHYDSNLVYRLSLVYNVDTKGISNRNRAAVNSDLQIINDYKENKISIFLNPKTIIFVTISFVLILTVCITVFVKNKRKKEVLY